MMRPNGSAPRKETESDDLLATGSDAPQHLDNNTLAQILRLRFMSQFRNTSCVPRPKTTHLTPHPRELGSVFEGPRLEAICEWGLAT